MNFRAVILGATLASLPIAPAFGIAREADGIGIYVGVDARTTVPTGALAGLPEPNFGRLTFLYDHGDHFHGIGAYSYTGAAPHPGVRDTNSNNRLPETFSMEPPLPLTPGTGLYAGKLRSDVGASEYSYLGVASIQTLAGFPAGSTETILLNSSGGRWASSLAGVTVGLKLLSATPGLHVGTASVSNLFAGSDTILLGLGNSFEFKPVYWVDATAPVGKYSAEFKLVNLNPTSPYGDSGRFYLDFGVAAAPVPEPETYALMICGIAMVGFALRKRQRKQAANAL